MKQNQEGNGMKGHDMERKILSLRNDAVFKLFFTREDNIPELKSFLKATTHLTDEDLSEIQILNPTLKKEHLQDKDFVVDLRIRDSFGNLTHIEMQMRRHDAFIERMVAYNSRQYASQLSRGQDYIDLRKSISLVIVDFPMFDDTEEYFEHITYRRKNRKIFTNAQEYFILDLTKLPRDIMDSKEMWGALFKAETEEELKMLMTNFEEMNEACEKLVDLSEEKYAQELAIAREDSEWTAKHIKYHLTKRVHAEGKAEGLAEGIEKGIEQGKNEGLRDAAYKLLLTGMPIEDIVEILNIEKEKILEINESIV